MLAKLMLSVMFIGLQTITECFEFIGVLISGGMNRGEYLQSVEIYNPTNNTKCSLPQLPEARRSHTQDGGLVCVGLGF